MICLLPCADFALMMQSQCGHTYQLPRMSQGSGTKPWAVKFSSRPHNLRAGKKPVSLKNTLNEAVKIINVIKPQRLSIYIFLIFSVLKYKILNKAVLLHKVWQLSWEAPVQSHELQAKVAAFLMDRHFYLREELTNYGHSDPGI